MAVERTAELLAAQACVLKEHLQKFAKADQAAKDASLKGVVEEL